MEVTLTKDVSERVKQVSRQLGLSEREFVLRSIRLHLHDLQQRLALKEELAAWDQLSDESLAIAEHVYEKR